MDTGRTLGQAGSEVQPVAGGLRLAALGPLGSVGPLVDWSRPRRTCAALTVLSALLWLTALGPVSSISLLSLLLAVGFLIPNAWSSRTGVSTARVMPSCWDVMQTEQDPSELIPSLQLLLKETCAFRQQHPGKFCLLVCSMCTFFAMLGRYIPGVVISYAFVLGIFLWPLLSSLDLEPILQKMDLGLGNFLHRIRENHESGQSQPQPPHTEAHSAESDLSSMVPQVDLNLCKELCVSDTEASEISWTEGAFTLSEGHTPFSEGHTPLSQGHTPVTDQSEELDREGLADHLPEFPSLDNGSLTNGSSDEDDLYLAAPHPSVPDPMSLAGGLVSAVIQQRMESALGLSSSSLDLGLCAARTDDSDSDVEDFELLDQSELEQCETELGLVQQETQESTEHSSRHTVHGFISRLLRRQ